MKVEILHQINHIGKPSYRKSTFGEAERMLSSYLTERGFGLDIELSPVQAIHGSAQLQGIQLATRDESNLRCYIKMQPGSNKTAWKYVYVAKDIDTLRHLADLIESHKDYEAEKQKQRRQKPVRQPEAAVQPAEVVQPTAPDLLPEPALAPTPAPPLAAEPLPAPRMYTRTEFIGDSLLVKILLDSVAGGAPWFKPRTLIDKLKEEFSNWPHSDCIMALEELIAANYLRWSTEKDGMYELHPEAFPDSVVAKSELRKKPRSDGTASEPPKPGPAPMVLFKGGKPSGEHQDAASTQSSVVTPISAAAERHLAEIEALEAKAVQVEQARAFLRNEDAERTRLEGRVRDAVEELATFDQRVRDAHSVLADKAMTDAVATLERVKRLKK